MAGIYGEYADTLQKVMDQLIGELSDYNNEVREKTGDGIYEHLLGRVKSEESMREKMRQKRRPPDTRKRTAGHDGFDRPPCHYPVY